MRARLRACQLQAEKDTAEAVTGVKTEVPVTEAGAKQGRRFNTGRQLFAVSNLFLF
jgi:hypothetical protein